MDYKMAKDADEKNHVEPTHYGFEFEVKDNARFNLTNLFNGNKQLSKIFLYSHFKIFLPEVYNNEEPESGLNIQQLKCNENCGTELTRAYLVPNQAKHIS